MNIQYEKLSTIYYSNNLDNILSILYIQVLQEQIANVQNDGGEPRVLIEADPDNNGSLRYGHF